MWFCVWPCVPVTVSGTTGVESLIGRTPPMNETRDLKFCLDVAECDVVFDLLVCCAMSIGSFLPTFASIFKGQMSQDDGPETSVRN
jgi:hypothetical protein